MNLKNLNSVYFIGIGGIGMSALARYFNYYNIKVSGYDKTETPLTKTLVSEGIVVYYNEDEGHLNASDLVVYTPAIPKENTELKFALKYQYNCKKRAEVLGEISAMYPTIAVGGTHGKTTVTCMLAHLLKASNFKVNAFIGGVSSNYNSNLILSDKPEIQVIEADEFDRSFLRLKPAYTVLTSTDQDHLDIYSGKKDIEETFGQFVALAESKSWVNSSAEIDMKKSLTYSIKGEANCKASNIKVENGSYFFDIQTPASKVFDIELGIAGRHNVENATVASAVFLELGGTASQLIRGLKSFAGIKRRFETHCKYSQKIYIDDYAHHPTELMAFLGSVQEMYPSRKITGIFQPHLYTRTRDFVNEFAIALSVLDEVLLLDIYPARELSLEGVTSEWLLNKIKSSSKKVVSKSEAIRKATTDSNEIILTMGAGDIDQIVEPIKIAIDERYGN